MHFIARRKIGELAKLGIELDPVADFHHLVELNRLASIAGEVSSDWKVRSVMFPTRNAGNVTLRRLSISARKFLYDVALDWFAEGAPQTLAIAYAMAQWERPYKTLWAFADDADGFRVRVDEWCKELSASVTELMAAVKELIESEEPATPRTVKADEPDYGDVATSLAKEIGKTPEYWLCEASETEVAMAVEKLNARIDRQNREAAMGSGRAQANDPEAEWVRAIHAIAVYKKKIIDEKRNKKLTSDDEGGAS